MQPAAKGASVGAIETGWSSDALEYQLSAYRVLSTFKKISASSDWVLIGSTALSTYLQGEYRLVTGLDVAVPAQLFAEYLRSQSMFLEQLNSQIRQLGNSSILDFSGFPFEVGVFEASRNMISGRLRFVSVFRGGFMNLKSAARFCPGLSAKMAMVRDANILSGKKFTPFYLDIRTWSRDPPSQTQWLIHHSKPFAQKYFNAASSSARLPPLDVQVSSLDLEVASKLNMIYQSAVNERLVRATPLSSHHAARAGRQRVSPSDIYDFCEGARQCSLSSVKKLASSIVTEPVNALLDTVAEALRKLGSTKLYEELNPLLPPGGQMDAKTWKALCEEAVQFTRRIRE